MKIDVSVIILNFNTKKLTIDCIRSVYKFTKKVNFEIIAIDNASVDGSSKSLSRFAKNKNFTLIKNNKNVGFGRGNNQGIKISKGRYILLLNSDTILTEDSISTLVRFMDGNEKSGIASCRLLNADGTNQSSGGYFPTLLRVFLWMSFLDDIPLLRRVFKSFHPEPFRADNPMKIDWVMGSVFLIREELVKDVGYFDKDYFMYTEEVDYCFRAKKSGWEVWFVPDTSVIHLGGASSNHEFVITNEFKGIATFYKKHASTLEQFFLRIILFAGVILRMIIFRTFGNAEKSSIYKKSLQYI